MRNENPKLNFERREIHFLTVCHRHCRFPPPGKSQNAYIFMHFNCVCKRRELWRFYHLSFSPRHSRSRNFGRNTSRQHLVVHGKINKANTIRTKIIIKMNKLFINSVLFLLFFLSLFLCISRRLPVQFIRFSVEQSEFINNKRWIMENSF